MEKEDIIKKYAPAITYWVNGSHKEIDKDILEKLCLYAYNHDLFENRNGYFNSTLILSISILGKVEDFNKLSFSNKILKRNKKILEFGQQSCYEYQNIQVDFILNNLELIIKDKLIEKLNSGKKFEVGRCLINCIKTVTECEHPFKVEICGDLKEFK